MKLAIVSSYSESCGNAAFTRVLHDSIEKYHQDVDVEVVELDLTLLQSISINVRQKGDDHIAEICNYLKNFDAVNIQMEAGLYGTLPKDIVSRVSKLIKANKHTSVTMHSPRLISSNQTSRNAIKKLLKFDIKGGLREFLADKYSNVHLRINENIIKSIVSNGARIIVHTLRAQKQINNFFNYDSIDVHPLKMVGPNYAYSPLTMRNLISQVGLNDDDVLIGMFGYISAYKGHVDAIKAIRLLPKNYKLLIFGRQHPQTLKSNGLVDGYLDHLLHIVSTTKSLKNRVLFMGELNDQDFLDVVTDIDVAWLPYYENGQDGSGIASICVDLCPRVLCSTSFAFDELFKLANYKNVMRFDIGNILEMSSKTQMILKRDLPIKPFGDESSFNLKSQSDIYLRDTKR